MRKFPDLPANHKLIVYHFHRGNDPTGKIRSKIMQQSNGFLPHSTPRNYVTVASVVRRELMGESILTTGYSFCNPCDQPDRRRGYQIATRRALKAFFEGNNGGKQ